MKTFSTIFALNTLFVLAPLAIAIEKPEVTDGPKQRDKHHADGRHDGERNKEKERKREFNRLDLDRDGMLTFIEFSQAEKLVRLEVDKRRKLFDFLDQNQDGKLEGKELSPRESRWSAGLLKDFPKLDVNRDQNIDFEEFSSAKQIDDKSELEKRVAFGRLDHNSDGFLTHEELRSVHKPSHMNFELKRYDLDHSKSLNYEEYSELPFVKRFSDERRKKHFQKIDANGDGELSHMEIQAAHKLRPRSFRNGDEKHPWSKRGKGLKDDDSSRE